LQVLAGEKLRSLYICYYPLTDPLVQTQVVAYLAGLARCGHTVHLLSYEATKLSSAQKRQWRTRLKKQGITWHALRYHKSPTVPATLFDVLCGIWVGLRVVRRYHLQCIHARAHVPAAMGLALKYLLGTRLIFDIRGLMAEEYEDAGRWARDGLPFRAAKSIEGKAIERADGLVVLTERVRRVLFEEGYTPQPGPEEAIGRSLSQPRSGTPLEVIPCCADLSMIEAQASERDAIRERLGLQEKTVLVYVGKFGGWYLQDKMADFFAAARSEIENLHFLILTQSERELIESELQRHGIEPGAFTVTQVAHAEVGAYLAASDIALSFIEAAPSKIASSPTKIGEYLAAGLPVVCNPGVGDVDLITDEFGVGVVVREWSEASYKAAARAALELSRGGVAPRCREAAQQTASLEKIGVPRYNRLYRAIARNIAAGR
jgi:glycosyltransferase involved in cell wall biosynthesis